MQTVENSGSAPRNAMSWTAALISLFIPFVFYPTLFDPFQLPKEAFFRIGTLGILGVWLFYAFRSGSVRLARVRVTLPLMLLLFLAILSVFQASYKAEAIAGVRDGAFCLVVFLLLASSLEVGDRRVAAGLGMAASLTALGGLLQILLGSSFSWLPPTMGGGLAGDVSTAAVFVAITLPLLVSLAAPTRGWTPWIWGAGAGISAAFVLLARARAAWLGALCGLICLIILGIRRARREPAQGKQAMPAAGKLALFTACALAILAVVWGIFVVKVPLDSAPPSYKTSELQGWKLREDAWRITRGIAFSRPLGAGAANWRYAFAAEAGNAPLRTGFSASRLPLQSGNEYLQILAELGPAALVLALWAAVGFLGVGWRRDLALPGFPTDAAVASLWGLVAVCFLYNPFREQPTLWAATLIGAMVFCRAPGASGSAAAFYEWRMEPQRRRRLAGLVTLLFVALCGLTVWRSAHSLLASAQLKSGQSACARGDYAVGLPALTAASRTDPTSSVIRSVTASCALAAGKTDQAEAEIREALELSGPDAGSLYILAQVLRQQGHLIDAIATCEQARKLWPRDETINFLLGDLRRMTGDTLGASEAYLAALGGNPSSVEAYLRAGEVLLSRGQIVNAVSALNHAVNMDPFSVPAMRRLGEAYLREGDYDSAAQAFQNLLSMDAADSDAMLGLAGAFSGLQHYCEALDVLRKALESQTDPARVASVQAAIQLTSERCDRIKASPPPTLGRKR